MLGQFKAGTYTGTAAAVEIECGFRPIFIMVKNETDGDDSWQYLSGLAAGYAYQNDAGVFTTEAANGFTVSASGFTAGTLMSENAKTFRYLAF